MGIWNQFWPILSPSYGNGSSIDIRHVLLLGSTLFSHGPSYRPLSFGPGLDIWSKPSPSEFFLVFFKPELGKDNQPSLKQKPPRSKTQEHVYVLFLPMWREKMRMKLAGQQRQRGETERKAQATCNPCLFSQFLTLPLEASVAIQ